ncbi:MAG: NADH:ubiquinone oxidoreductase [Pseudomonadota bacterium]
MTQKTIRPDDRPIGAAIVAGLFAAVGSGMAAVMWGFGVNETGFAFIVLWLLIFLVLWLGWRDPLPPPGTKKAPTVASHTAAVANASASAPAAAGETAQAPSSGTAPAAMSALAPAPKPEPAPEPEPVPTPAPAATAAPSAETGAGKRPEALNAARGGKADDLKQIKGVGPALERLCNSLGFYHFDQIASWTAEEVAWVDQNLEGFKGRVTRDDWVAQAKVLAAGGSTEFSEKVEKGDVY